ncbi:neuronal membrane glycoprotein M6-b [Elysia marginata]|uniref:Neuronal membrane glycoprotein M6-b n=1 Tax=Elysia marginata TaxID=1093978 RepID=A0AAV4GZ32_9GAST|nr:neuronal membrane glycoprotein M6-b [Elysia marginata]
MRLRSGHSDTCCDKFLKCLGLVPCPTLLSWILLLLGLGCMVGAILFGTWDTRDLLEDDDLLWFMEYTVIGVSSGMFLVGCLILISSHLSSEPTSRRVFNSFKKNRCAQGMNIFALVVCYILTVCWVLATAIFAVPLVLIINMLIVDADSVDLGVYGFKGGVKTGAYLETFKEESKDLLICWGIVFCSSVVIVNSLICFIICITANITHLRDNRFATLNAYSSEEVRNSKHSVLDTNM